jgi:CRISPR-associated protein Csm4
LLQKGHTLTMDLTTYHIKPPSDGAALRFHFGRQGIGLEETSETLASDSLFAALVAEAAALFPARGSEGEPSWATPFAAATPPLRHSSLLPRLGDLVLLPRPALSLNVADGLRATIGKGFKKLRFLSPRLFAAVCAGEQIAAAPLILQGGKVWISAEEAALLPEPWQPVPREDDRFWRARLASTPIWSIDQIPRVTVDRTSSASNYYEVGCVSYAPEAGLALLVQFAAPESKAPFERLLTLLGESGLGGRRSVGYGAFRYEQQDDVQLVTPQNSQRSVLLSRYIPADNEIASLRSERAAYQLVKVGGWLYSVGHPAQRRQTVQMVAEGSLLDNPAPQGKVVDVRPVYSKERPHPALGSGNGTGHPVYRSGLALAVPIADGKENAS